METRASAGRRRGESKNIEPLDVLHERAEVVQKRTQEGEGAIE